MRILLPLLLLTSLSAADIRVSDNRRFLQHSSGQPFFYLADTAWELFHRLDRDETSLYLADRAKKGFTVIQAVALAEFNGLDQPNRYNHLPLINKDPRQPNPPYFEHIDWTLGRANSLGLTIGLLPTWGNKVRQGSWEKRSEVIFNAENAYDYGKWLGARYKDAPNLIWILGGDRNPDGFEPVWRAMARGIREADTGRHLITYHPQGRGASSEKLHAEPWLGFNMIQSGHDAKDIRNDRMIARDYALTPAKPVIDGEPRYENHPVNWKPEEGWFDEYDVRKAAYSAVFAGAAGHTYGCHDIWQFNSERNPPVSSARTPWKEALEFAGAAQMGYLRRLIESRDYFSRMPAQSLILDSSGINAVATAGRDFAMVYFPEGKAVTVKFIAPKIRAWWFDPRTARTKQIGTRKGESARFTPPTSEDWVLVIDDVTARLSAPGSK